METARPPQQDSERPASAESALLFVQLPLSDICCSFCSKRLLKKVYRELLIVCNGINANYQVIEF